MGQFALGVRSLLVKSAVFVVMAALLAWALGGTLFPKPAQVNLPDVLFFERAWHWRLSVRDQSEHSTDFDDHIRWDLIRHTREGRVAAFPDLQLIDAAGPVAANNRLCFAGLPFMPMPSDGSAWFIAVVDESGNIVERQSMPDRLAVEQQLARFANGLPIQDHATILAQRQIVLDPQGDLADKE